MEGVGGDKSQGPSTHLLVVHLDGLDLGGDVGRGEGDNHSDISGCMHVDEEGVPSQSGGWRKVAHQLTLP